MVVVHSDEASPSPPPAELMSLLSLRSEEYRQLFRLPADEVLIQGFDCALQENFLLQGHMYLFVHSICFYSNLFGFETKKIIPFHEITSVRRAKVAAIFPIAIEIIAGGKKFLFTSFLSCDEAFKLINVGWLQHSNGPKATGDLQEPYSKPISQENMCLSADKTENSDQPVDEAVSAERNIGVSLSDDTKPLDNGDGDGDSEIVPNPPGPPDNLEEGAETVQSTDCSSRGKSLVLEEVDYDAPQVPDSYTKVAESKFPVKVEKFFDLFFSDDGIDFQESFHKKCGDKGIRFASCQELMKYRVYRNCHLVVETSQEINDVQMKAHDLLKQRKLEKEQVDMKKWKTLQREDFASIVLLLIMVALVLFFCGTQYVPVNRRGKHGMGERGIETLGVIDKQINHLREEMLTVLTKLDKMQNDHALLKLKFTDSERIENDKKRPIKQW